ncbi:MAG: hypothetical protein QMD92_00280 [bacterium]|nr:hypothetical protein [bacterium]
MPEQNESAPASQVEQIGEILNDFTPLPVEKPKETPKEEPKGAPKEEVKEEAKEVVKEVEEVGEKDVAIKTLADQIKVLNEKIAELSKPKELDKPKEEKKDETLGLGFFKDKAEYEAAFEKPEVMSEVMGRVKTDAVREVLKALPQVLNNVVKSQMEVHSRTTAFFNDNKDLVDGLEKEPLASRKQFIGYVANDLSGKNPDWTLEQLFEKLPGEIRVRLGMKAEAKKKEERGPAVPPRKGAARIPGDKREDERTSLEKEIMELI